MIKIEQYLEEHPEPLKQASLCFLFKQAALKQDELICLAQKKKPTQLGKADNFGKFNGYGGDLEPGENINHCLRREVWEETGRGVRLIKPQHVAELYCYVIDDQDASRHISVYLANRWSGEPKESDEMGPPSWYPRNLIPRPLMWAPDKLWIPFILAGCFVKAQFLMNKAGELLDPKMHIK